MNKAEFIDALARKALISKKEATAAVNAFQEVVTETLVKGDEITLTGFGKFKAEHTQARQGRNPQTGEVINIPAKIAPKFRPGKNLKDALN